jgi:hypothetical protein
MTPWQLFSVLFLAILANICSSSAPGDSIGLIGSEPDINDATTLHGSPPANLLSALRAQYHRFADEMHNIDGTQTDAVVIARIGDGLDEFSNMVSEVSGTHILLSLSLTT